MIIVGSISGISEVVGAFLRREVAEEGSDPPPCGLDSALGGLSQQRLELCEGLLDDRIATAFGCLFEGGQSPDRVLVADLYLPMGVNGITLTDTTGMANPRQAAVSLIALARGLPALIGHDVPGQVIKAGRSCDLHAQPS